MIKFLSKIKIKLLSYKLYKPISQSEHIYFSMDKKINHKKTCRIEILYIFGIFFYLISLKHINGIGMRCFHRSAVQCLFMIAKLIFCSSIFFSISIFLILFKNNKKIHLIYILFFYILFILFDHNNGIIKHGLYNFIVLILMTFISFFFLCFIYLLFKLFKTKNYITLFVLFSSLIMTHITIIKFKATHFSCIDWDRGLNNTYINNSDIYPCKINIPQPHSCYLTEIGKFFDFSSKYRPTCLNSKLISDGQSSFLKFYQYKFKYSNISSNNHFGFPITNTKEYSPYYFGTICKPGIKKFYTTVNQNIILMDLYYKNKNKYYPNIPHPEVEVIFKRKKGKIRIKVSKNETLIKERKTKINETNIMYKNILIFFLDTVSRNHFMRKLPKTMKFLNSFSKYETNPSKKKMTIFQFFKYNSLNCYTDPNLKAIYYGAKLRGNGTHFGIYFKRNGYITGRVNSYCGKESVKGSHNQLFIHNIFDHEGLSLGCMKPFYDGPMHTLLGSLIKKCLFGKDLNEYALEYLKSFWKAYINQNKMFLYQSLDGHEPSGQAIGHFDKIFYKFLTKFYQRGYLNKAAILIFSDHGQHLNGPLYLFNSQDFYYERTLPGLFLILPNDEKLYKNNLYENIKLNQQTFITGFDIYNTLVHLAFGNNKKKFDKYKVKNGETLFKKINYKNRYCESKILNLHLSHRICNCRKN